RVVRTHRPGAFLVISRPPMDRALEWSAPEDRSSGRPLPSDAAARRPARLRTCLRGVGTPGRAAGCAVVLCLVVAGCEFSQREYAAEGSVQSGAQRVDTVEAVPALTNSCVNPREGYSVSYPAGWHVNPGDVLDPCSLFDPDPIDVPRD